MSGNLCHKPEKRILIRESKFPFAELNNQDNEKPTTNNVVGFLLAFYSGKAEGSLISCYFIPECGINVNGTDCLQSSHETAKYCNSKGTYEYTEKQGF